MIAVFTLYLFALAAMMAHKRKMAIWLIILGLLLASYIIWYHATSSLGINL